MSQPDIFQPWLAATEFIDHQHPAVRAFTAEAIGGSSDPREQAVKLYYAVRDQIRYDPYLFSMERGNFSASATLAAGAGYCIPKAVLYAAGLRSLGIPARPGFADVKNHLSTEKLTRLMGTDIFAWHGYVTVWLDGRWVKATPAFNIEMCERFGVLPLEFDGYSDSLMHPYNSSNQRHMEYVKQRGEFDDLPYEEIVADMRRIYPHLVALGEGRAQGDFAHETVRQDS